MSAWKTDNTLTSFCLPLLKKNEDPITSFLDVVQQTISDNKIFYVDSEWHKMQTSTHIRMSTSNQVYLESWFLILETKL